MSAYKSFSNVKFQDTDCLLAALKALGFRAGQEVKVYEDAVALVGFRGKARAEKAHIVIRRQHIGGSSNDVGFVWDKGLGAYVPIVSEFDERRWLGGQWQTKLKVAYARAAVHKLVGMKRGRIVSDRKRGNVQVLRVRLYA